MRIEFLKRSWTAWSRPVSRKFSLSLIIWAIVFPDFRWQVGSAGTELGNFLEVAKRTNYSEDMGFEGAFFPCNDRI